jgi:preprotein translocase YajC subunit
MNDAWTTFSLTLAQSEPQAGAAPAAAPSQPVNAVGVPGSTTGTTGTPSSGGGQPLGTPASGGPNIFLYLFPLIALMLLMTVFTGRKDKKKRAELMNSLKKHDKVQMIGGEIGTVTELTPEEVVVRFEEGRIRFARSAVQAILSSKSKPESTSISEVKGEPKTTSV